MERAADFDCPCKRKCPRHGKCDECRAFHKNNPEKGPVKCEREKQEGK